MNMKFTKFFLALAVGLLGVTNVSAQDDDPEELKVYATFENPQKKHNLGFPNPYFRVDGHFLEPASKHRLTLG